MMLFVTFELYYSFYVAAVHLSNHGFVLKVSCRYLCNKHTQHLRYFMQSHYNWNHMVKCMLYPMSIPRSGWVLSFGFHKATF